MSYSSLPGELQNKVCLIVGATGTLGTAVAETFGQAGARLALTGHSAIPEVAGKQSQSLRIRLDVARRSEVLQVLQRVRDELGSLDVVVNCSGIQGPIGPLQAVDPADWVRVVEINLFGCFYLAQAAIPIMISQRSGKIIFFSGGGATSARPFFSAYGAAKAAVVRLTETLAAELRDHGVQVNAIAPGAVHSRMWNEMRAAGAAGGQKLLEELEQMDRTGGVPPTHAASLALFLASNRSKNLSGRLISAVHDKWEEMEPRIGAIMSTEAGTLRRIPLG